MTADQRSYLGRGFLNAAQQIVMGVLSREPERVAAASLGPFGGQLPELATQRRDVPMPALGRQTQVLEGRHQVAGPEAALQVGRIGPEMFGRDRGQGVPRLEFSQEQFPTVRSP